MDLLIIYLEYNGRPANKQMQQLNMASSLGTLKGSLHIETTSLGVSKIYFYQQIKAAVAIKTTIRIIINFFCIGKIARAIMFISSPPPPTSGYGQSRSLRLGFSSGWSCLIFQTIKQQSNKEQILPRIPYNKSNWQFISSMYNTTDHIVHQNTKNRGSK